MDDKDNDEDEDNIEDEDRAYVFSSKFYDLCMGDLCIYYFYCFASKFGLLKLAVVTMPKNAKHDDGTLSRLSVPVSKYSKRDSGLVYLGDSMRAPIEIPPTNERKALDRINDKSARVTYIRHCITNTWTCTIAPKPVIYHHFC